MAESRQVEVTDAGLTEDYSCGYCLQRLLYMTDPRELPCSHVFCLPCLQEEFTKWNGVQCGICQRSHDVEDVGSLPKAQLTSSQQHVDTESLFCDVCKDTRTKAVSFCVDCERKLCENHAKLHDEHLTIFSDKQHNVISIDVYKVEPNSYKSKKCTEHEDHQLQQACSVCYKTFCIQCETGNLCEESEAENSAAHVIHRIQKLAYELREKLMVELKTVSNKVTELCRIEKEAWLQLSDVEDNVRNMREFVDKFTEKKVAEIKKQSEQLKTEIQDYLDESTNKVEVFVSELKARKDDMERVWKSTRQLVKNSHNSELIRQYRDVNSQVENTPTSDDLQCKLISKTAVLLADLRLVKVPSDIEFKDSSGSKDYQSVKMSGDGRLLCGTDTGAEIRNINTMNVEVSSNDTGSYEDVIQSGGNIVSLKEASGNLKIAVHNSLNFGVIRTLQTLDSQKFLSRIAQSGSDIYFVDCNNKQLKVCSLFSTDNCKLVTLDTDVSNPFGICTLPDDCILVSDYIKKGSIIKYQPESDTSFKQVWTCSDIAHPADITYDPQTHLIYVTCSDKFVAVLSPHGALLKILTCEEMKVIEDIVDIAVSGDQIILACNKEGLKRFTIKY